MHKTEPTGKRITVESISVTTIRTRRRWQKIYCDACKQEIESTDLVSSQQIENEQIKTLRLPPAILSGPDK